MGKHKPKHQRKRYRLTKLTFPINALMLMALVHHHFESTTARQVPLHSPRTTHVARDNYEGNYEDGTAISSGYTLSRNYFDAAPSFVATANDKTPMYGNAASSSSASRFENLQRFPSTGFTPTTMTAAGQHFVEMEKGDELTSAPAMPQIGGMRATGRYTVPPGKIDYEINAANYDAVTEIANSGSNEPGADIMQSNDAYNFATLHDLAHLQQANRQRKPHRQPHYLHHSQHQLEFDVPSAPEEVQSESEEFESYKNDDATGTTPMETKYQQLNTDEQGQQQKQHHQKQQQQKQQQQQHKQRQQQENLHNFEMLQYANNRQKPDMSGDLFHRGIYEKASKRGQHPHTFVSLEPMQLSHGYRIVHNQKQPFKSTSHQHRHSRDDDSYAEDTIKSQSRHYYSHAPVSNELSAGYGRSLHINHEPQSLSQSMPYQLPVISHTVHHTPASSAAAAGIPLSKHVEVIKHVPIPHHQRELVPYNHSVPIEIPSPVITTIRKPVPINIPIPQTVAVPQLQLVKIPIERIRPMPVERPVPYIVEKRVPYHIEKQVAKPVFVPYPLRVPVVNTVVHKLPRHGHALHYHYQSGNQQHSPSRNSLYTQVFAKSGHFG